MKRRDFLKTLSAAATVGLMQPRFILAQGQNAGPIKNFVHIFLYGGADGRFMFPYFEGEVADLIKTYRGTYGYPEIASIKHLTGMKQNGRKNPVGLHPYFSDLHGSLENLNSQGKKVGMTIFTEYGVTEGASFSHEAATNHYLYGTSKNVAVLHQGWLSKLIDTAKMPAMSVWGLGESSPIMFNANETRPLVLSNLAQFRFYDRSFGNSFQGSNPNRDSVLQRSIAKELAKVSHPETTLDKAMSDSLDSVYGSVGLVSNINSETVPLNTFMPLEGWGHPLQNSMADIGKVIKYANSERATPELRNSAKILCTSLGGWDAHTYIRDSYNYTMKILGGAVKGLVQYLADSALLDSTIIQIHTEFGRTTRLNASYGLDHASANLSCVIGGRISNAVIGPDPSAQEAKDKNNFTPQIPFTSVIREILSASGFSNSQLDEVFKDRLPGESKLGFIA